MATQMARHQAPIEETWRIEDIFATKADWEAEMGRLHAEAPELAAYRNRLDEGASVLCEWLDALDRFDKAVARVTAWAELQLMTDGAAQEYQANQSRVAPLRARAAALAAQLRSAVLQLPTDTLSRYTQTEAGLQPYRVFLEQLARERPHSLDPAAEAALAGVNEVLELPYQLYNRMTAADMQFDPATNSKGESVPMSVGRMSRLERLPDNALRRSAWSSLIRGLTPYQNTMAAALNTHIRRQVLTARMRGFDSARQMFLESSFTGRPPQGISVAHFEWWMDTLQTALKPHMQRYARIRRRALGLDKLLLCDTIPFSVSSDLRIPYEQGVQWVKESVAVLGAEYSDLFEHAFAERWIDRADNAGRAGMAFCRAVPGVHCYVFSTWIGTPGSLSTLAHEMGHAGHMELAMRYHPHNGQSVFFVEAPSTLNQLLLFGYLRRTATDAELLRQIPVTLLSAYYHQLVTHMLEAELLRRLYRLAEGDQPLTAAVIGDQNEAVLRDFWGEAVALDAGARLNWMRQPHYYMGLYPYTYSVGISAATAVAQMIETEGAPAAARWVEVLKAGGSRRPEALFRMAGVDVTRAETIEQAVAFVAGLIDEMERDQ